MLAASEARQLTDKVFDKDVDKTLDKIERYIVKAAKKGNYRVIVHKDINMFVKSKLEDSGYTIKEIVEQIGCCTTISNEISWNWTTPI